MVHERVHEILAHATISYQDDRRTPPEATGVFEEVAAYHERHKPQALLVAEKGKTVYEAYGNGLGADTPHALYSGTKSFWGVTATIAEREGLLSLDEPVAQTIPEWKEHPWKARATLRQLLQLTAGVPFGGLGAAVPIYSKALPTELRAEPGATFTYGGIPLQIFGAVFSRKLQKLELTPHEYLEARILKPNGIAVASWRRLSDGTQPLPTGAFLTAQNWLSYGEFVRAHRSEFAQCFVGSQANARYGLGWWLAPHGTQSGLFYASGSGGQALYVIPSIEIVAVRYGGGGSYNHEAFLKRLAPAH